ncbi:MAG: nucleoside deaminase [Bryobacteraceae bacterium]|nr:nucleoside deaminase [Bryobacteraceae bacterium]
MRRAIELAANAPDFPFAAVLVDRRTDRIVAEGWNRSTLDPTFHGEMDVIHECARRHPKIEWAQLALYTTAEPCPMCQGAVAWTGISLVAYGTSIPYLKKLNWWQIDIRAEEVRRRTPFRQCTLVAGVLEKECNALFDAAVRRQK